MFANSHSYDNYEHACAYEYGTVAMLNNTMQIDIKKLENSTRNYKTNFDRPQTRL